MLCAILLTTMKFNKSIFKDWSKEIITSLIVALICWLTAFIWSRIQGKTLSETIYKIKTFLKTPFAIPLYYFLVAIVGIYLFIKIKSKYFDKKKRVKIGHFTFIELYDILRIEYVHERTEGMRWSFQQPITANLLDQFIGFHPILSQGVDFNTRLQDGGYVYGILCPKFYGYGLLDKVSKEEKDVDITTHSYSLSDNGKLFWATLNKSSIKNRKKEQNSR